MYDKAQQKEIDMIKNLDWKAIEKDPLISSSGSKAGPSGKGVKNKRPLLTDEDTVTQSSKKANDYAGTVAPDTHNISGEEVNMPLSGSAMETEDAVAPKTGQKGRGFAGGFSTATGPEITIPRPRNFYNGCSLLYNKVHRVMAYGIANAILPRTDEAGLYVSTSLMEIPVDKLMLYMNPGEIASLPPGAYAKSCHVKVVQRNPRVAFETAATSTALATLNQNKFGIKAVGLNNVRGIRVENRFFNNFNATEPMIPISTDLASYANLNTAMYGVPNSDPAFDTTIPASPFMIPMAMPNYLCCVNIAHDALTNLDAGWYSLAEHVTQFDMQATAGTEILNYDYTFKYAPLTPQLAAINYVRDPIRFTSDSSQVVDRIDILGIPVDAPANTSELTTPLTLTSASYNRTAAFDDLLEQGQRVKKVGTQIHPYAVQPSVHIGISPVPRLTTTVNTILGNSWTDVQAYYEIEATLEVGFAMPHHNTHLDSHNIEMDNIMLGVDSTLTNRVNQFGRYHEIYT